jgi:hypothetical protein
VRGHNAKEASNRADELLRAIRIVTT